MNENPYAPPAEIVETANEEEIFKNKSRRMMWGVFWIFMSTFLAMSLFLFVGMASSGMLPRPPYPFLFFFQMLILAVAGGIPLTQLIGLVFCCFCPDRMVKGGWVHVIGSVTMFFASIGLPIWLSWEFRYTSSLEMVVVNLFFVGSAISILVWQFFLLRLAHGLDSMIGKRLAWALMGVFGLLAAGMIAYINIDFVIRDYGYQHTLWHFWSGIQQTLQILGYFTALGCLILYAVLLETLRRRIRREMEESF